MTPLTLNFDGEIIPVRWNYVWRNGDYTRRDIHTGEIQWWNGCEWEAVYNGVAAKAA